MANGLEDLKEKNSAEQKKNLTDYGKWRAPQGREDAEMLLEKSSGWSAVNNNRGDYDSEED